MVVLGAEVPLLRRLLLSNGVRNGSRRRRRRGLFSFPAFLVLAAEAAQGTGLGEGLTAEPTSAVAADDTPQLQCTKCNQDFPSRNALYRHLRLSGHADFSALSSLDVADSASGVLTPPAASLMLLPSPPPPPDLERQLPPPPPRQQVTPLRLGQGGSPARSSAVTTALRVPDVPAHHGPAIHEKRRKGPYR